MEIGPGKERIPGFETINIRWQPHVDYVGDVSRGLPFSDNTFDLIYASHVLEHIPWYMVEKVLTDWVRTLKVGGSIEIWVPNGLLIAQTFVDAELGKNDLTVLDGWYKFNELKDPCVWANGRIFSYGDGSGKKSDPNWHLALFSPRLLSSLMLRSGLSDITGLTSSEVRGHDHGWINLGYRGRKL